MYLSDFEISYVYIYNIIRDEKIIYHSTKTPVCKILFRFLFLNYNIKSSLKLLFRYIIKFDKNDLNEYD